MVRLAGTGHHPGYEPPTRPAQRRNVPSITLSIALLAGCGGGAGPEATPAPTSSVPGSVTPAPGRPDPAAAEEVASGLEVPWGLAFLPDGAVLVAERETGRVLRVNREDGRSEEVYRVPGVTARGEGGLLGLALAPDFARTGQVYAYFTSDSDNRIVRFRPGDDGPPEVIFRGLAKATVHNGGRIAFGPDGMLYVGTGDAGQQAVAQDPDRPNGKILRLTPDGRAAPDNPTPGSPVYSLGHRNVQGLAWDADGRLFATEFGQNRFDEINLIEPGRNYGWPEVEGRGDTAGGRFANPLLVFQPAEASPSGAAITADTLYVAALRGQRLWAVPLTADGGLGEPTAHLRGEYGRLRTVAADSEGNLWVTTSNTDGVGDPRPGDDRLLRIPSS